MQTHRAAALLAVLAATSGCTSAPATPGTPPPTSTATRRQTPGPSLPPSTTTTTASTSTTSTTTEVEVAPPGMDAVVNVAEQAISALINGDTTGFRALQVPDAPSELDPRTAQPFVGAQIIQTLVLQQTSRDAIIAVAIAWPNSTSNVEPVALRVALQRNSDARWQITQITYV